MCGFTGFTNHIDNSNAVLQEMLNRIKHRGPDAEGTYIDEDIALGHRRLSIIRMPAHSRFTVQMAILPCSSTAKFITTRPFVRH